MCLSEVYLSPSHPKQPGLKDIKAIQDATCHAYLACMTMFSPIIYHYLCGPTHLHARKWSTTKQNSKPFLCSVQFIPSSIRDKLNIAMLAYLCQLIAKFSVTMTWHLIGTILSFECHFLSPIRQIHGVIDTSRQCLYCIPQIAQSRIVSNMEHTQYVRGVMYTIQSNVYHTIQNSTSLGGH